MLVFSEIDWEKVIPQFNIDKKFLSKRHGPCPICNGKDRYRFINKDGNGTWFCSHCRAGNGFSLIRKVTRKSDSEILAELERITGLESVDDIGPIVPRQAVVIEMSSEEVARNLKRLKQTAKDTLSIQGHENPVTTYLKGRVPGLQIDKISKSIRIHPALDFYETDANDKVVSRGKFPTMICNVVDAKGKPVTLHRTYLTNKGEKAPFDMVKKQMGGVSKLLGAAIRLNEVKGSRVLGITEGVETGLAVMTAYRYRMPVWSLLNCYNLAEEDIPRDQFDEVIIFADHDALIPHLGHRPGEHYANILKKKLEALGFKVTVKLPPREGTDYCDLWKEFATNLPIAAEDQPIAASSNRKIENKVPKETHKVLATA